MATEKRLICTSADLIESGQGVRFETRFCGRSAHAFAIRFRGQVYAYINECGHVPAQLDWLPGAFFDYSKLYLICSIHGALYSPDTGRCMGGPCRGVGLKPLLVEECGGQVFLLDEDSDGTTPSPRR